MYIHTYKHIFSSSKLKLADRVSRSHPDSTARSCKHIEERAKEMNNEVVKSHIAPYVSEVSNGEQCRWVSVALVHRRQRWFSVMNCCEICMGRATSHVAAMMSFVILLGTSRTKNPHHRIETVSWNEWYQRHGYNIIWLFQGPNALSSYSRKSPVSQCSLLLTFMNSSLRRVCKENFLKKNNKGHVDQQFNTNELATWTVSRQPLLHASE